MEGLKCWHRTSEGYLDIGTSVRRAYVHVYVSRGLPWTCSAFCCLLQHPIVRGQELIRPCNS
jgi:hypothetical protein